MSTFLLPATDAARAAEYTETETTTNAGGPVVEGRTGPADAALEATAPAVHGYLEAIPPAVALGRAAGTPTCGARIPGSGLPVTAGMGACATAGNGKTLWRASLTALAVANALDIHSSWGKHELNSTLAGPGGNFGRNGALIKLGLQGGLMGFEYLITRGHPSGRLYRALSILNFGAAAAMGSVAAHNYTIPRR